MLHVGSGAFKIFTKLTVIVAQWRGLMICNSEIITVLITMMTMITMTMMIMIMIVALCCSQCLCFLVLWNISININISILVKSLVISSQVMKPVFFGSHATSTTFLCPSLRNWFWKPFSEMLLLKLLLLLLFRYVLLQKCDNFITKCDRYYKVRWLLQSAIEQTFKLKRSSSIDEQSGKNRWHRTLRPAKDWRGDTQ